MSTNTFNTKKIIGKYFSELLVAILIIIIILQKSCGSTMPCPEVNTIIDSVHDTTYIVHDSIIKGKPKLITSITHLHDTLFVPDSNYDTLRAQYMNLVSLYTSQNIYVDTIKVDTLGYVEVIDTVYLNTLTGAHYHYKFNFPVITNTITIKKIIKEKKRNQVYFGGGIEGNKFTPINQIYTGFSLKTKSDNLYNIKVGIDKHSNIWYGIGGYFKITL